MKEYQTGDIVELKKQHPCGSHRWQIVRVGAEIRLKCMGCSHQVMMKRNIFEKSVK